MFTVTPHYYDRHPLIQCYLSNINQHQSTHYHSWLKAESKLSGAKSKVASAERKVNGLENDINSDKHAKRHCHWYETDFCLDALPTAWSLYYSVCGATHMCTLERTE